MYDYHFRHTCRPAFRFALNVLCALMILAGYSLIRQGNGKVVLGLGLLAAGVYWFAFRRWERRWTARRQFRKRPDREVENVWQLATDKIRTQSSLGQSELNWQAFIKVVCTPDGLMLYPLDQMFHWLPRVGFATDAEFERGAELARSKIGKHYALV